MPASLRGSGGSVVKVLIIKVDMPRTRTQRTEVWWLDAGSEVCEHCLQRYTYEVEVRCDACDAALCPHCAVSVKATRESFCPGCEEA